MKKTNIKLRSKSLVIVNLFLIFTLMTVSVYSWFASHVDNRVDAYEIQVESDDALELTFDAPSKEDRTWSGSLNLAQFTNDNGQSILETMKFVEVTGDGTNFSIPQLTQMSGYAKVNTTGTWNPAVANRDYLEFTVYMRSKDELNVYLSSESAATPSSKVYYGENCGNHSTVSLAPNAELFSKDCVVGALRVAYTPLGSSNKKIWITNPNFHLDNLVGDGTYAMVTNAGPDSYSDGNDNYVSGEPFYWNNPYKHYYYNSNHTCVIANEDNVLTELPESVIEVPTDGSSYLAQLSGEADADGYHYASATFTVWIEGCDTEARRALIDGKFNLSLIFDTYGIQ